MLRIIKAILAVEQPPINQHPLGTQEEASTTIDTFTSLGD